MPRGSSSVESFRTTDSYVVCSYVEFFIGDRVGVGGRRLACMQPGASAALPAVSIHCARHDSRAILASLSTSPLYLLSPTWLGFHLSCHALQPKTQHRRVFHGACPKHGGDQAQSIISMK